MVQFSDVTVYSSLTSLYILLWHHFIFSYDISLYFDLFWSVLTHYLHNLIPALIYIISILHLSLHSIYYLFTQLHSPLSYWSPLSIIYIWIYLIVHSSPSIHSYLLLFSSLLYFFICSTSISESISLSILHLPFTHTCFSLLFSSPLFSSLFLYMQHIYIWIYLIVHSSPSIHSYLLLSSPLFSSLFLYMQHIYIWIYLFVHSSPSIHSYLLLFSPLWFFICMYIFSIEVEYGKIQKLRLKTKIKTKIEIEIKTKGNTDIITMKFFLKQHT